MSHIYERALLILVYVLVMLAVSVLAAQISKAEERSVSVTMQQTAGETSLAGMLHVPYEVGVTNGHIKLQSMFGDILHTDAHAEAIFGYDGFGTVIYSDSIIKGYQIGGLGTDTRLGISLRLPRGTLFRESDIRVGFFGKSAGEFAPATAHSVLVSEGFAGEALPAELNEIYQKPAGMTIRPGNSLNGAISAGYEWLGIRGQMEFMRELSGNPEALTQAVVSATMQMDVGLLNLHFGGDIGMQVYGNTFESESIIYTGVGFKF